MKLMHHPLWESDPDALGKVTCAAFLPFFDIPWLPGITHTAVITCANYWETQGARDVHHLRGAVLLRFAPHLHC